MKKLLIAALSSAAAAAIILITQSSLAWPQLSASGLLVLAVIFFAFFFNQRHQQNIVKQQAISADLQRLDSFMRQQQDILQGYLSNLESFLKIENEATGKRIAGMEEETSTLASRFVSLEKNLNSFMETNMERSKKLEKSTQNLGVLLTSFSKAQDTFRSKSATAFQTLLKQAEQLTSQLETAAQQRTALEQALQDGFSTMTKESTTLLSLQKDTASTLRTFNEQGLDQLATISDHGKAVGSLLENLLQLTASGQEQITGYFAEQSDSISGLQERLATNLHTLTTLAEVSSSSFTSLAELLQENQAQLGSQQEMVAELANQGLEELDKIRLADEVIAQLVAENGNSINELQQENSAAQDSHQQLDEQLQQAMGLLQEVKDESNQELTNQAQVISALDSKIASQQNALLAALRQVERSHRPQGRLEGDLNNMTLPDLLQILQLAKKTAAVFLKEIDGAIYLEDGLLVYVRQGKFAGIQAFIRIMILVHGYFSVRYDSLPSSLPKKPRQLIPEMLGVITEVDEIKQLLRELDDKIKEQSGLTDYLIQLPSEDLAPTILETFNYQAPASLQALAVQMGGGVRENIALLEELADDERLTLIS